MSRMSLPKWVKIKQHFSGPVVEDIEGTVSAQLSDVIGSQTLSGKSIAITAGSRGIANIHKIIQATVKYLVEQGAQPFIIPAMGSHGGATAEGQVEVLESLGVTEAFCGAPIRSSMDVVEVGQTADGVPVYVDKQAWEADAILLMGRVKVHTDFKSPIGIESGLMKMAAIGMGKHKQALAIHDYGVHGIRDMMPHVARVVFEKANILCGVAIVENAFEQTAKIEVIPTNRIEEQERRLLKESAALMPSLPMEDIDLLIVDEIGKNHSGTGMDTNIIGRLRILGVEEPTTPRIKYILASDLSEASHGNALGIGLADLTTRRLFEKIDLQKMNENVITSSFLHRAMIPIVMESDRAAIMTALRSNWGVQSQSARVVRIPSTLHLEYLYVSESLLPEVEGNPSVEVLGQPVEMAFDEAGYFPPFNHFHTDPFSN